MLVALRSFRTLRSFQSLRPLYTLPNRSWPLSGPIRQISYIIPTDRIKLMEPPIEDVPKEETVRCLSAKEMKALVKPTFEANPDKFYPTETFAKLGFSRAQCKCGHFYWRKSEKAANCGDSACKGSYTFIGKGCGIGKQKKVSYHQAWKSFERSFTTARIPCTAIDRYPVIARWRNDVQYVAAGIFCFQPYCVTGEMDPPANPLICPQFCLRFNDLDNIGLTGRHFSGFVMLGIQVFNKPQKYIFFKEEVVEFNYRWLTEELKIDPEEITFVEDIWAGGGNLGPCVEYFVHGLQLGNMVFMQFKYDNVGNYTQLPVKVIDVGIGLERIPWVLNGSPTSYVDVFKTPFEHLAAKLEVELNNDIWNRLGPYTCKLDVDEAVSIEETWKEISQLIGQPVEKVKSSIIPIKELYVILDHTRTVLMIIQDGGLPSNTGGGANCRNVLRRVFAILNKNGWWNKIGGVAGLIELFDMHKKDLAELYGPFPQYKSFTQIITMEFERWSSTESAQKKKLQQLVSKAKGKLTLDNWIMAMQSWGIPADAISQICKSQIPDNLYYEIARRQQTTAKAGQIILYDTLQYPETECIYFNDHRCYDFDANVVAVLSNVAEPKRGHNIVILSRSAFYPTSGGQVHDIGKITIANTTYDVYNVEKVGKCFLHYLSSELSVQLVGAAAKGSINRERRNTLRCFHTSTHIVYAAARRVLGPHIWQNGAKKTQQYAHIDITHYSSLTKEITMQIENQANRIVLEGHPILKYFEDKKVAELKHGFNLYQGGIVPGNIIRVVNITDVDVQACCGTHCDNTSEVGWIKIYKSARISDGILRLYFVAGLRVMSALNEQTTIINDLKNMWKISQDEIVPTAKRFFEDYKKFEKDLDKQKLALLGAQVKYMSQSKQQLFVVASLQRELTLYFSNMNTNLVPLLETKKTVLYINDSFIFGIVLNPVAIDLQALKLQFLKELKEDGNQILQKKLVLKKGIQFSRGKQKIKHENGFVFSYTGPFKETKVIEYLVARKFVQLKM